ncbi:MAG: DUF2064 domain-containing protein, partial [Catenulispora sp.]|nr:DUF2064 domain-containing protein [Catenulispora sp.]
AADDALPGGGPLVVIGTDAPTLTADMIVQAFTVLDSGSAAAIGPALDGGYYLLAVHWPHPAAFAIDPALWSGPHVMAATVSRLRRAGRVELLPALRDLDTPEDAAALLADPELPDAVAKALLPTTGVGMTNATVSIVMPTLNEAAGIVPALTRLGRDFPDIEIVVVDGGSTDGTADLAAGFAKVVGCEPGRGRQLNTGAQAAGGEVLWFVHADTVIDPAALDGIRRALDDADVVGGGLTLRFDHDTIGLRFLAWSSNQRARRLGQIFGDQAMFVRRTVFDVLGGFPDYPLMEDFEFSRRLHKTGRLAVLTATSTASARRFQAHGTWRMIAFMQIIKIRYLLGASPETLRRSYTAGPPSLRNLSSARSSRAKGSVLR